LQKTDPIIYLTSRRADLSASAEFLVNQRLHSSNISSCAISATTFCSVVLVTVINSSASSVLFLVGGGASDASRVLG